MIFPGSMVQSLYLNLTVATSFRILYSRCQKFPYLSKYKYQQSVANEKSNLNFGQRQRSCSSGNTEDEDGDCPVDAALGRPMQPGCCKCGGYLSKKLKSTFFQWTSKISKLETM